MDAALASQLVTAVATLSGVVLTLATNAFLERRRARDARAIEEVKLAAERAKWLREARQKAYADLSIAGENAIQFVRVDLRQAVSASPADVAAAEARWVALRTQLRLTFNHVALFGPDDVRAAARDLWRAARNTGNDFFDAMRDRGPGDPPDRAEELRVALAAMGAAGDRYLEACRSDLGAA